MKYLGPTFDIHSGGVDLIFPHHENEIAQSEGATGKKFVNYWIHCSHLIVEGEKMSKSRGNYFTLRDILDKGYPPEVVRYLLLSTHYRKNLDFTFDGLKQARHSVERIRNFTMLLENAKAGESPDPGLEARIDGYAGRFTAALLDDLNVSEALAAVFDFMSDFNRHCYEKPVAPSLRDKALGLMLSFDKVLKILKPSAPAGDDRELAGKVEALIRNRQEARQRKDWAEADRIRDELKALSVVLEDTKEGVKWRKTGG
jgi:cysteinyl-tRNA synthetase